MARPRQFDRDDVLDGAMEQFWRHGYAGTSVDDLVVALGLARASMYRTFGNKAAFYDEALRRYRSSEHDRFERCAEPRRSGLDTIAAVFQLLVEQSLDTSRPPGCFIVAATAERVPDDPTTTKQVAEQLAALEDMFTALVGRAVADGELAADLDVRPSGRLLTTTFLGLRTVATARPDRNLLEDIVAAVLVAVQVHPARRA